MRQEVIMNKDQNGYFRKLLVEKMECLRTAAYRTKIELKNNEGKHADPCDLATVETSNAIELNFRSKEWHLLHDIKETLLRIDHGLFGICKNCGCSISQKRLIVAPMSKLCVMCQEEIEYQNNGPKNRRRLTGKVSYNHV